MELPTYIYWNHDYNGIVLLVFAIAIGLFTLLRLFSGVIAHISSFDELVKRDNSAFGISLAGTLFAVLIILMGTIHGTTIETAQDALIYVGVYGLAGIVLMAFTRLFFDNVVLPSISLRDEIAKGNCAAALLDAGNVIATAIVLHSVMVWVEIHLLSGIVVVAIAYFVSQLLLSIITLMRVRFFARKHTHTTLQKAILDGNIAVAMRFSGYRIGTAFAVVAAYYVLSYDIKESIVTILLVWSLVASLFALALTAIDWVATRIIFWNIPVNQQVVSQGNIAIGSVQMAVYISLGMLFTGIIANGVTP